MECPCLDVMKIGKVDGQEDAQTIVELDTRKANCKIHSEDVLFLLEVVEVHGEQVGNEKVDKSV